MATAEQRLEQVTKAICLVLFEDPVFYWGDSPISVAVDKDWGDYKPLGKAAIKAMEDFNAG
jgi:hypothetical protein